MEKEQRNPSWWGDFDVTPDQSGFWQVGPLELYVGHRSREWRIAWRSAGDHLESDCLVEVPTAREVPEADMTVFRVTFRRTSSRLSVVPALADRPVVVRPLTPLYVPAGEQATLYVSTPAWIQVRTAGYSDPLLDVAISRPSDTWFGPDTREGELCYASRTVAQLAHEDCVRWPHRAITPVTIQNQAADALLVERISVPVPVLNLHVTASGYLWTESVSLARREDGQMAALQIMGVEPPAGESSRQLAAARERGDKNVLLRAISRFFS